MIAAILNMITGGIWPYIAAGLAALAGALGLYVKGRADAKDKRKVQDLQADAAANERINHADTGIGATDDERIKRLHDFADKYRK